MISYDSAHCDDVGLSVSQVSHLEPWEKNSRKTAGQIGMCAGVGAITLINASCFHYFYKD